MLYETRGRRFKYVSAKRLYNKFISISFYSMCSEENIIEFFNTHKTIKGPHISLRIKVC